MSFKPTMDKAVEQMRQAVDAMMMRAKDVTVEEMMLFLQSDPLQQLAKDLNEAEGSKGWMLVKGMTDAEWELALKMAAGSGKLKGMMNARTSECIQFFVAL